jgi:opacity protein-like surface antigen
MKKLILSAAFIAITASTASAADFTRWYVGLGGGINQEAATKSGGTKTKYDTGQNYFASMGYKVGDDFRLETEIARHNNDDKNNTGKLENTTYSINAIYDIDTGASVKPYIGGGVGVGHFNSEIAGLTGTDNAGIYNFLVGFGYEPKLLPRTTWSLGYRLTGAFGEPEINGTKIKNYHNSGMEAGLRVGF